MEQGVYIRVWQGSHAAALFYNIQSKNSIPAAEQAILSKNPQSLLNRGIYHYKKHLRQQQATAGLKEAQKTVYQLTSIMQHKFLIRKSHLFFSSSIPYILQTKKTSHWIRELSSSSRDYSFNINASSLYIFRTIDFLNRG